MNLYISLYLKSSSSVPIPDTTRPVQSQGEDTLKSFSSGSCTFSFSSTFFTPMIFSAEEIFYILFFIYISEILFSNFSFISSYPGLPRSANIFFLYSSTPGWSKGLTSSIYPSTAHVISKK